MLDAEHRNVGVVVELEEIRPPAEHHRESAAEHDADHRLQAARPRLESGRGWSSTSRSSRSGAPTSPRSSRRSDWSAMQNLPIRARAPSLRTWPWCGLRQAEGGGRAVKTRRGTAWSRPRMRSRSALTARLGDRDVALLEGRDRILRGLEDFRQHYATCYVATRSRCSTVFLRRLAAPPFSPQTPDSVARNHSPDSLPALSLRSCRTPCSTPGASTKPSHPRRPSWSTAPGKTPGHPARVGRAWSCRMARSRAPKKGGDTAERLRRGRQGRPRAALEKRSNKI